MTVKMSFSLPDDVAEYVRRQPNASAEVAEALRARMDVKEEEHATRRREAEGYARYLEANPVEGLDEITAASNELSLREAGLC
jgi:hypothetical protein